MDRCPYEVLQVRPDASEVVVRASYKALVQRYHPDRYTPADEAERLTKELNSAFAILSSPQRRAEYDERRRDADQQDHAPPDPPKQATPQPPPSPPPPQRGDNSSPKSSEAARAPRWSFWLMVIGAFVLVRVIGPLPAVATLGLTALVWQLSKHKPGLVKAGAATLAAVVGLAFTLAFAVSVMEYTTPAKGPQIASAANSTAAAPSQRQAPTGSSTAAPSAPEVSQLDPLTQRLIGMSDATYLDGVNRWLAVHPELEEDLPRQEALVAYMQATLAEDPTVTLGASLDESLRRLREQEAALAARQQASISAATRPGAYAASYIPPAPETCPPGTIEQRDGHTCCKEPVITRHSNGGATMTRAKCFRKDATYR